MSYTTLVIALPELIFIYRNFPNRPDLLFPRKIIFILSSVLNSFLTKIPHPYFYSMTYIYTSFVSSSILQLSVLCRSLLIRSVQHTPTEPTKGMYMYTHTYTHTYICSFVNFISQTRLTSLRFVIQAHFCCTAIGPNNVLGTEVIKSLMLDE